MSTINIKSYRLKMDEEIANTEEKAKESKQELLSRIKRGDKLSYDEIVELSLSDLLLLDENGIPYLEYACKNKLDFYYELYDEIVTNKEALYICAKNNYLEWIYRFDDEEVFFEKLVNGKTLIEYIYENKVKCYSLAMNFKKHYEIIDYLIKYDNNAFSQISEEIAEMIFADNNGTFIVDKYINNDKLIRSIINKVDLINLLHYCNIKSNYEILKDCKEGYLLTDIGNGKLLIEELFDRGISPTFYAYDFKSKTILDILVERGRIDLLYNASLKLLFKRYNQDKIYFDLMIDEYKKGKDVHFESMSPNYYSQDSEIIASKLIIMAKNNIIGFVPEINIDMLLYKSSFDEKSVIEWLIEMDKELTVSTILKICRDRDNQNFAIILRALGIDDALINVKTKEKQFSDEYVLLYNNDYAKDYNGNCEELINELKELFYQDGKSDKSIIDTLIISYKYIATVNETLAEKELKYLIEIKKRFPDKFAYIRINNGAYFLMDEGVCAEQDIISTLNHETSHALHYYLADNYIPDNYSEVIERARNRASIVERTKEHSQKFHKWKNDLLAAVSKSKISDYYDSKYEGENIVELAEFLMESREKKKERFKDDYPDQVLDTILAKTYSVDEYIAQRKEIEALEVVDATLRNEYDAFLAIGDIIDAVFMGKYKNGVLIDDNREIIEGAYGHGISYYSRLSSGFYEMIADYGEIIKAKNGSEMLVYLRSVVGDEVVDMIEDCYENRILNSQVFSDKIDMREEHNYGK